MKRLREKEAQVAKVVPGGAGDDGVSEGGEEGTGVELGEGFTRVVAECLGAADGGGVGDGSGGGAGVAVDAIRAGAEDDQVLAGITGKFEGTVQGELHVAAAGAWSAVEGDGDFTAGDETTPGMLGAKGMEALEQIAGCVGVVPVIAGVVDDGVVAGFLGEAAGAFDQVVAGEKHFKDGVAEGVVLGAEQGGRLCNSLII